MPSRDLQHSIAAVNAIPSTAVTNANGTTTAATGIDTQGWESVTALLNVTAYTDGSYSLFITDCATLAGTYSAGLTATQYIGQAVPAAVTAAGVVVQGIQDCQRYIKPAVTQAGGTSGATFYVLVILGHPRHRKAAV